MAALEVERARNRSRVARRLIGEMRPWRGMMFAAFCFIALNAAAQGLGPYLVSRAIDHHILRGDARGLAVTLALLLGVYVLGSFSGRAQTLRVGAVGQHVLASLRARLFSHLQSLPLSYFDRRPVGDLMSRLLSDVDTLNQFFSQGLTQLLGALLGLVGVMIFMLWLNVKLALACFTVIPVMLLTTWFFAARARAAYRKARETVGDVTAELQQEIVGIRQAQAFNRTEVNIERFRQRNAANRDANVAATGVTSAFSPMMELLSTLSMALVIGLGGWMVLHHQLTVGLVAAFLIYVQQFFRPVQLAASVYTLMQSALAGAERVYGILDERPEPADAPEAVALERIEGHVVFDHVGFSYEGTNRKVLDDVSFEVKPGQTVALVGKTGAGKTTIASLIPRLYDVTEGTVRIDGHDVRLVKRESLRRQMTMVIQEPFLFSGTIAENIAYGRPDATREEIEAAARAVYAHDFIAALPQGYDSRLGEGGATLSQGQRQLIAFARAVIGDPRVLILDEATASIDTRTEALIQQALATLLKGRSSVVIAHRLSTIRNADQILVIDNGRIVERGTHDELIARQGAYAELYSRQFRPIAARSIA
ncbi:MAG: ABC transporter ATP-binding protein [Myxococcaceae bacterium]|nr:ABC transporter ATP-binding protein [Myxococcaceae bacterium]